jgi:hypothetical protein
MVQSVSVGLYGLEPSQSSIGFGSTHLSVRAENPDHGPDQQGCFPGGPTVMITDHVPEVRVPPDHAGRSGLGLSRREEACKTAEILVLRHQVACTASELASGAVTCVLAGWAGCGKIAVCVSSPALPDHDPGLRLACAARPRPGVQGRRDHGAGTPPVRVVPFAPDQAPVPSEQGRRGHRGQRALRSVAPSMRSI